MPSEKFRFQSSCASELVRKLARSRFNRVETLRIYYFPLEILIIIPSSFILHISDISWSLVAMILRRTSRCRGIPVAEAGTLFSRKRKSAAGALRIPPLRSLGPSIGIHSSGWSERRGSILVCSSRPATVVAAAASMGFCVPPRFSTHPFFLDSLFPSFATRRTAKISLARDTHFSRLTVVEDREITTAERGKVRHRDNSHGREEAHLLFCLHSIFLSLSLPFPLSLFLPFSLSLSLTRSFARLKGGRGVGLAD